jgi:hypothetical protein
MTLAKKLGPLQQIADVILDQRLLALRAANAARQDTQKKIASLEVPGCWDACSLQSSAKAEMLYQAWADTRRKDLNLHLAKQTVVKIEAEDAARLAFSRHAALSKLAVQKRAQK